MDKEETEKLIQEMFYDRDLEQETTGTEGETNTTNSANTTNSTNTAQ